MARRRASGAPPPALDASSEGLPAPADYGAEADLRAVVGDTYLDWEAIYFGNVSRIYRLMFSRVGNRSDAEDLTAEVFLVALRPLRVSASVGEVRAYLVATAQTVLATFWRRRYRTQVTVIGIEAALDFLADPGTSGPDAVAERATNDRLARIMKELPERYRRVLELRFLEGCSVREAAIELGVTAGNAKVIQHRALRRAAEIAKEVTG